MSTLFFDTSALIKRYLAEPGSSWVKTQTAPVAGNTIVVSQITQVELLSVIARHQRGNLISTQQATALRRVVITHATVEYLEVTVDGLLIVATRRIVSQHYLRSLDAIQLASALEARRVLPGPIEFIAADRRLLAAAAAEGFATDDPNNHP